mgnify:FL=1
MDFQKQYRSMNEQIAPDGALVSDTLARIARGDKPYRRPRRLRRVVTLAVAAAVAIGCVTPALAANVPGVYQALYILSPAIAQALMPVNEVCEDQGVRMEVVSAFVEGDTAGVYLTLTDTTGELFGDNAPDLYDSYSINYPARIGQTSHCHLVEYDAKAAAATYYIEIANVGGEQYIGDKFTFSFRQLLTGKHKQAGVRVAYDLSEVPLDPQTSAHPINGASSIEAMPAEVDQQISRGGYHFLVPQGTLWQSDDGIFSLVAAGYTDGYLHLQYAASKPLALDNHAELFLYAPDGTQIWHQYTVSYNDYENDISYTDFVYPVSYEALVGCTLSTDMYTTAARLDGSWQVTFRLEGK